MEIGVDIVDISRIRKLYERYGMTFLKRIMTEREITQCLGKPDPVASIAGRFAAKEAVSKALGSGMAGGLSWKAIEILNDSRGKPAASVLCPDGRSCRLSVSISHDRNAAVAMALLEPSC
jgi:holo-[acyl-carrier protein] synthase